jgi:hypothetical protein
MALNNIYRDVAIKNATKQSVMVDQLLEEAPIVAMMPMEPTTHGLHNVFEEISSVTGAGMVDLDAALPTVNADTKLGQTDLSILGGTMFVGEDKANQMGGAAAYFAAKTPLILRKTGEDLEKAIIYNNIRAYAINEGKAESAGGAGSVNYSILAVTWTRGEVTGLYDPNGFGDGKVFDIQPLNGGQLYTNSNGVNGYGVRLKSYLGLQLVNNRYVSALVNIDLDAGTPKPPTERMMDNLLLKARANSSTVLYMHPRVLTELYNYKAARLQMAGNDANMNRVVAFWNGTPIITSYNFLDALEPTVALS